MNEQFQVLLADGSVMENVYAAGLDCSGVLYSEKKPYVTYGGANNGWGLVSGYLCGKGLGETLGQE